MELIDIINSCNYVVDNSEYVKINYDKLDDFIFNIECDGIKNWLLYNPYNILDMDVEWIVNFLLYFESICYSFWGNPKWMIEDNLDGSAALMYIMINYFKDKKNIDFSSMSFDKFKKILKGNIDIPLLKDRFNTVKEISNIVNEKMNGNFYKEIKSINSDNELFNFIISNFPSFKDERDYNSKKIYFYKLAQLLTSDILHIREYLENIDVDYSHLVGCADYKIPQVLRALDIIEYNSELSKIIDNKKELLISSKYEVEIRASQLVVINYIKNKLNNISAIDINDYLFMYSKKVKNLLKPYHLCRNTNY